MDSIKLQKYFTDCGVLSRRAAEREIEEGRVTVNGKKAYLGQRILPYADTVVWQGKELLPPKNAEKTYVLLHKPRGFVTTLSDEKGRKTVAELVSDVGVRVYPVGRLDMGSEGLLLLTDDGDMALKLTHPRHKIPKLYRVRVSPPPSGEQLRTLNSPMTVDGYALMPVATELLEKTEDKATLSMTLYEGRNRQIRKMCEKVGLRVLRLQRTAIGEITIEGLPSGKWRFLTPKEIKYLKDTTCEQTKSKK